MFQDEARKSSCDLVLGQIGQHFHRWAGKLNATAVFLRSPRQSRISRISACTSLYDNPRPSDICGDNHHDHDEELVGATEVVMPDGARSVSTRTCSTKPACGRA